VGKGKKVTRELLLFTLFQRFHEPIIGHHEPIFELFPANEPICFINRQPWSGILRISGMKRLEIYPD